MNIATLRRALGAVSCALAGIAGSLPGAAQPGALDSDPWQLCGRQVALAEQSADLPRHLLDAIAKVESGRWRPAQGAVFAWPWTVMAEGKGRFMPNRAAAIALVRALKARGIKNIDVGCMQVNLKYHPEAFADLTDAFDPARNVAYAAGYLGRLRANAGSWTKAIGQYHSNTPHLGNRYRRKVLRAWREERHLAARAPARRAPAVAAVTGQGRQTSTTGLWRNLW